MIELLVVISIMVILITMGLTSFTTVQKKSRDSKRKADLRDYKNALEQYFSICGNVYPTPSTNHYGPIICFSPVTQGILENLPKDPKTGDNYYCPDPPSETCNSGGYTLCADLEASSDQQYCITSSQ